MSTDGREIPGGRFRRQLEKGVILKQAVLVTASILAYFIGINVRTELQYSNYSKQNLETIGNFFCGQMDIAEKVLNEKGVLEKCSASIGSGMTWTDAYYLRRKLNEMELETNLILEDTEQRIVYTSFPENETDNYRIEYNRAVCARLGKETGAENADTIYRTVYYRPGMYSEYILIKPLWSGGQKTGFLSLYISGKDWNYHATENEYDAVVKDERDNVIFCSRGSFLKNNGKYYSPPGKYYFQNGERYWTEERLIPEYNVRLVSFIYYPPNAAHAVTVLIVISMGMVWLGMAKSMSRSMADNNSRMIAELIREIRVIEKGQSGYRIRMNPDNEFGEAGQHINKMLDSIESLYEKNMELLRLNNTYELNQLMAQINPHFLYNTLEIIKGLTIVDPARTESLIVKLTRILRYSIDLTKQEVVLDEDIMFLRDYLDIQKCRFGDRIQISISIMPECYSCRVPKLVLQPVVENSIKYGFRNRLDIVVDICGKIEGNLLMLTVSDNGPGMPPEELDELNASIRKAYKDTTSYGLHNICRRLQLQYGGESGISVRSGGKEGIVVELSIAQKERICTEC